MFQFAKPGTPRKALKCSSPLNVVIIDITNWNNVYEWDV